MSNTNIDLTELGDTRRLTDVLAPFKTKLPLPKTISFRKNHDEDEQEQV